MMYIVHDFSHIHRQLVSGTVSTPIIKLVT